MASNLLIFAAYGYMQNLTTLVQPLLREKNVGQEKIITFLVAAMFSFLSANAPGQYRHFAPSNFLLFCLPSISLIIKVGIIQVNS